MTPNEKSDPKEIRLLEKTALEFARKQLAPHRRENDAYPFGPFFSPILDHAFHLDFFHALPPEEVGGLGQGMGAFSVLLETLCREDASLAAILFVNACCQEMLLAARQTAALEGFVRESKTVDDLLIAFPAFNHPGEIKHLATARHENGSYRLFGSIQSVTLGGVAKHGLIPAKIAHDAWEATERRAKEPDGFSWFLVDLTGSNVKKSPPVLSLGLRSCPSVDVTFDGPNATRVGRRGCFNTMSKKMNLAAASMSQGVMKGSFDEALNYGKNRMQGGKKIIDWTEFQMLLADMAIEIEVAGLALKSLRQEAKTQTPGWENRALATAASIQKKACDVTSSGIQALGGVGYMKDFGQEKRFRDARQLQALLGLAPLKRINYFRRKMGRGDLRYETDPA